MHRIWYLLLHDCRTSAMLFRDTRAVSRIMFIIVPYRPSRTTLHRRTPPVVALVRTIVIFTNKHAPVRPFYGRTFVLFFTAVYGAALIKFCELRTRPRPATTERLQPVRVKGLCSMFCGLGNYKQNIKTSGHL